MITTKCLVCKKVITGISSIKYCSENCRGKAYRIRNPESVKIIRKRNYDLHKDEILEKQKYDYWNNGGKEKSNLQSKDWYYRNRDRRIIYTKKYRQNNKKLFDKYKDLERFGGNKQEVLKRDCNKCVLCQSTEKLAIHHLDGTGGSTMEDYTNVNNAINNLVTLCSSCHGRLHAYEHRLCKRFNSIEDIVRTMPKVIEEYRKVHPVPRHAWKR